MKGWRYRVSFICWALGHAEPLWHCGATGMEWRCECGRRTPSVLKHLGPFGI